MSRRPADPAFVVDARDHERASLDLAMAPMTPPEGLWDRIAVALQEAEGVVKVERLAEGRWRTLAPGVRFKRLWDRNAILIECDPGASIPHHEHQTFEHALVLRGDLVSDNATYLPGDYHGTPAGGTHEAWTTKGGCLVMVQYAA